jgi:hypothetical protein
MSAKESALIPIVKNLNRSTTNTEYTIDPQRNIEKTHFIITKPLR